jgi:hypothetical protein
MILCHSNSENSHQSGCCVHNVFVRFYSICNKGKGKVATPCTTPWRYTGEWSTAPPFLTLGLGGGKHQAPASLKPGAEPPGTHWIGGWIGPRDSLDAVEYCWELNISHPTHSSFLYQLSYHGSISFSCNWLHWAKIVCTHYVQYLLEPIFIPTELSWLHFIFK